MDAKITLKFDKEVVEKAKVYAASQKRSLSRIIESYLKSLTIEEEKVDNQEFEISSFIQSIAIGQGEIPANFDYKNHLSNIYSEKYK